MHPTHTLLWVWFRGNFSTPNLEKCTLYCYCSKYCCPTPYFKKDRQPTILPFLIQFCNLCQKCSQSFRFGWVDFLFHLFWVCAFPRQVKGQLRSLFSLSLSPSNSWVLPSSPCHGRSIESVFKILPCPRRGQAKQQAQKPSKVSDIGFWLRSKWA